jgi:hypothetical protein
MFQRLITAAMILLAAAIIASGFPLSSLPTAGSWFALPLVF